MSDFPALDDFNDFSAPSGDSQGDFLARERELLGDEFGPTPTGVPNASEFNDQQHQSKGSFPELDDMGSSSNSKTPASAPSDDFMSSFERDPAPAAAPAATSHSASVAVDDDDDDDAAVQQFQSQYPDVQIYPPVQSETPQPPQQQQQQNGFSSGPSYQSSTFASSTEPESDAVRAWREKQEEEIASRDKASAERKEEMIRKAEAAIDDFYAGYNQKKEKQIAQNKENEAAFVQARDDALAKGTTWERIADLVELQDSRSKTVAKGSRDVSRMKEVLLTLKREGDKAPNAAGY